MRKAAIIAPNSLPVPPVRGGGIQNVIAETTPFYKDFKPYVFSNSEYGIDSLPLRETDGNIEHFRICQSSFDEFKIKLAHFKLMRNYFPYIYEIIGHIKEIKPDIIHVMNRPWFLPFLRKYLGKNIKIVYHHFNNYLMEMGRGEARKYIELADGCIGCSKFTINAEVLERFPEYKDKCFVVSNGVNMKIFDHSRLNKAVIDGLRKKYGIGKNDKVVLYVGRLTREKGAGVILKAVKKLILNNGIKDLKLIIVGSSFFGGQTKVTRFMEDMHADAKSISENIVFTGFINRPDIPDIYGLADIAAVPSIVMDASPSVCYEASAMGLPIVASKRGGIPEIVLDGKTGLLADDPENIDELAEKMLYFINNPEKGKEFGERGRQLMEKQYTWQAVAAKIEQVYNKVIRGSK